MRRATLRGRHGYAARRGAIALVGVGGAMLAWSVVTPAEAARRVLPDDPVRDEFRSQMIAPLALGADTGRRMAATAKVRRLARAPERPRLDLVATMPAGESLESALMRAGIGRADATRAALLIDRAVPSSQIAAGTRIDVTLGRRPTKDAARPLETLALRARFDLELEIGRSGGTLALTRRPIAVDETPLRVTGEVGGSLYRAARAAGAPAEAVQQFLKAIGEHADLDRALTEGDRFDLVLAHKRAETGERQAGDLLYAGIERGGKPTVQLVRWGKEGKFFEASGVGEQKSGLVAPVPGTVSSRYGMRRHPILGYRRMHSGLDFRAGHGTPIVAPTDGRVAYVGRRGGYGKFVRLDHAGGLGTGFAHLSDYAVRPGQQVRRGQVIGYVGSTGLSTGPHLHYEMYRDGRSIDPQSVRFVTRAVLEGEELRRFRARLEQLRGVDPGAALADLVPATPRPSGPRREIDRLSRR